MNTLGHLAQGGVKIAAVIVIAVICYLVYQVMLLPPEQLAGLAVIVLATALFWAGVLVMFKLAGM